MAQYEISEGWLLPAMIAGAVAGAVVSVIVMSVPDVLHDSAAGLLMNMRMIPVVALFGGMIFLFGMMVFAVPAWMVLHAYGFRGWLSAVAVGALTGFAAAFLFAIAPSWSGSLVSSTVGGRAAVVNGTMTGYGWWLALQLAAEVAIGGAAGGLTVWRIAYRRVG